MRWHPKFSALSWRHLIRIVCKICWDGNNKTKLIENAYVCMLFSLNRNHLQTKSLQKHWKKYFIIPRVQENLLSKIHLWKYQVSKQLCGFSTKVYWGNYCGLLSCSYILWKHVTLPFGVLLEAIPIYLLKASFLACLTIPEEEDASNLTNVLQMIQE